MKALTLGVTALSVLAGAMVAVPAAQAQARDTAASTVPPMQQSVPAPPGQIMSSETPPPRVGAPRFVWKGGYVHGKWREGWVPVKKQFASTGSDMEAAVHRMAPFLGTKLSRIVAEVRADKGMIATGMWIQAP